MSFGLLLSNSVFAPRLPRDPHIPGLELMAGSRFSIHVPAPRKICMKNVTLINFTLFQGTTDIICFAKQKSSLFYTKRVLF